MSIGVFMVNLGEASTKMMRVSCYADYIKFKYRCYSVWSLYWFDDDERLSWNALYQFNKW